MFQFLNNDKEWLAVCISALALVIGLATFVRSWWKDRRDLAIQQKLKKPEITLKRVHRYPDEHPDYDPQSPGYLVEKVLIGWKIDLWISIRNRGVSRIYLDEMICSLPDIPNATFKLDSSDARHRAQSDNRAVMRPTIKWLEPGSGSLMGIEVRIPKDSSTSQVVFSELMMDVEAVFSSEVDEPPLKFSRRLRLPEPP